jgi:hypothetical protein
VLANLIGTWEQEIEIAPPSEVSEAHCSMETIFLGMSLRLVAMYCNQRRHLGYSHMLIKVWPVVNLSCRTFDQRSCELKSITGSLAARFSFPHAYPQFVHKIYFCICASTVAKLSKLVFFSKEVFYKNIRIEPSGEGLTYTIRYSSDVVAQKQ